MGAIRAIKAGEVSPRSRGLLLHAATDLVRRGAEILIAGCTEIPLGLPATPVPVPVVDPTLVLARALLRHIGVEPLASPPRRLGEAHADEVFAREVVASTAGAGWEVEAEARAGLPR